jgi:SAM-dependent methyltransferase
MRNKYQRIIRDGKELQPGSIDTHLKFNQLTRGINFKGEKVIDLGCNLGEMCRLSKEKGAKVVVGIDRTIDFIRDARKLNPEIKFIVGDETKINGKNNIVIASAMFHYVKDHDRFFKQIAKSSKLLLIDVWLSPLKGNLFELSKRGLYIPTRDAFEHIVGKYFNKIEMIEESLSPDNSSRFIYRISKPNKIKSKAIILHGVSESGKTTLAKEYQSIGYHHLSLDLIFMAFYKNKGKELNIPYSVRNFIDNMNKNVENEYYEFLERYVKRWLSDKIGHDIVIEGYSKKNIRDKIKKTLDQWSIEELKLKPKWWEK